ncbi:glycosyltransferase family 92 protein [Selenomonas sp. FC4001]|uniref:glycosyltransferase family 92 protein n=1 Tax=Selenomonas sp. FC4001 TaxID=1408313 RepID=UPI00056D880D|nr:glycosyltransferase family 92 protein [Selenomonas sp. FC4001]
MTNVKIIKEDDNFIFEDSVNKDWKYYKYKILDTLKAMIIKYELENKKIKYEKKKYHVSLCSIFKDEGKYLKEWVEFHRLIGIDHFYMYDNNSTDNSVEVLKPYINMGIISLKKWKKNHAQLEAYKNGSEIAKNETEWLGFIDIDEFVILNRQNNIYDILKNFKKRPSVLLYWHLFGTSGLMNRDEKRLVIEDFTIRFPKLFRIGKCFWNTAFDIDFSAIKNKAWHHSLRCKYEDMENIPPVNTYDEIAFYNHHIIKKSPMDAHINHYFTKSFCEYEAKSRRGDVYFKKNPHDNDYFFLHEMMCNTVDYSAYRFLMKLKLAMRSDTEK